MLGASEVGKLRILSCYQARSSAERGTLGKLTSSILHMPLEIAESVSIQVQASEKDLTGSGSVGLPALRRVFFGGANQCFFFLAGVLRNA
jgi:hypothetical protein